MEVPSNGLEMVLQVGAGGSPGSLSTEVMKTGFSPPGAVKVGLNVRAQIEQITFLCPNRQEGAAALKDIGGGTGLQVGEGFFFELVAFRIEVVVDPNIRMRRVKFVEHLLNHRRKPVRAPIAVDELDFISGAARWAGARGIARGECCAGDGQTGGA